REDAGHASGIAGRAGRREGSHLIWAAPLLWAAALLVTVLTLAYRRASLRLSCCVLGLLLAAYWVFGTAPEWWEISLAIPYALLVLLNVRPLRLRLVTRPFL